MKVQVFFRLQHLDRWSSAVLSLRGAGRRSNLPGRARLLRCARNDRFSLSDRKNTRVSFFWYPHRQCRNDLPSILRERVLQYWHWLPLGRSSWAELRECARRIISI